MRLLIITLTILFFGSNGLVVLKLIKNFNENEIVSKETIDTKIITITVEIKEHLPIREDLCIRNKYYVKILNSKISIINLITDFFLPTCTCGGNNETEWVQQCFSNWTAMSCIYSKFERKQMY